MTRCKLVTSTFFALTSLVFLNASAAYSAQATPQAHTAPATQPSAAKKTGKKMEKVVLEGIRLITPEKEIEANVETADMTRFVNEADTAVQYLMHASPRAAGLIVQFECTPTGKTIHLMVQGKPEEKMQEMLAKLRHSLDNIQNMNVKAGTIEFTMQYAIAA